LVICFPDALFIAEPAALVAAVASTSRLGVLIRDHAAFRKLGSCTAVLFDKTGTLTDGNLEVCRLHCAPGVSTTDLVSTAAALARVSLHPFAKTILELANRTRVPPVAATAVQEEHGLGLQGIVNREMAYVGRAEWIERRGVDIHTVEEALAGNEQSSVVVACGQQVLGCIFAGDRLRSEAKGVVALLRDGRRRDVSLITGDRKAVAESTAAAVGGVEARSECTPEMKVKRVEQLHVDGHRVVFVGDGLNDAAAMTAADVGIALAANGCDVTAETASVVLLRDRLDRVPYLFELSSRTAAVVYQNLAVGLLFIVAGLALAASGWLLPEVAALSHLFDPLIIFFNSARLVRVGENLH
jgi:Cd2+/Zn2+-exporting ATPase